MSAPSHLLDVPRELPLPRLPGERAVLARPLSVVREMLGMLDTLTIAGQRHLMEKVVGFVELFARAAVTHPNARRREALFDLVSELRKESERLVPDALRFTERAENLIALLGPSR